MKQRIKNAVFLALAPFLGRTATYRTWAAARATEGARTHLWGRPVERTAELPERRSGAAAQRVSVVVPNYNYAKHLEQRLASIFAQTYPLFEVIVLDDASTDDSIGVIRKSLAGTSLSHRIVINEQNSASVFEQWQKGIELAAGDYVWICEADDFSDPRFVEKVMRAFEDERTVLAYAQSRQVDDEGRVLAIDYLDETDDISARKWRRDYRNDGRKELATALAVKNTIPNVSAVIFRKKALSDALGRCREDLRNLQVAGDWLIYAEMLREGNIGFVAEPLNAHRRHGASATLRAADARQMAEICFLQERIARLTPPENDVVEKARRYAQQAYEYLRLGSSGCTDPSGHPEVRRFLEMMKGTTAAPCGSPRQDTTR